MSADATCTPATLYTPEKWQTQQVWYRATDTAIYRIVHNAFTGHSPGPSPPPNGWDQDVPPDPVKLGGPATMRTFPTTPGFPAFFGSFGPGQEHMFHINASGQLRHIFEDEAWGSFKGETWASNALPSNTPSAFWTEDGQQHVFYVNNIKQISQALWDPNNLDNFGNPFTPTVDTWGSDADLASGNLATMRTPNQQHVFFKSADPKKRDQIWHMFFDESTRQRHAPDPWVGHGHDPNDPLAAGDPVALYTPNTGQQHIFYLDTNGCISHVYYDPTAKTVLPKPAEQWDGNVAGNPATLYTPDTGQHHIFYRDMKGTIYHMFYDVNTRARVGPEPWGDRAIGDPAALWSPDNGQQHVFYVGAPPPTSAGLPVGNVIYHAFYVPGEKSPRKPEIWPN